MALGRAWLACSLLLVGRAAAADVSNQPQPWPPGRDQSIKQMFGIQIPMRDGVSLVADVWMPAKPGKYPLVLHRTPYQRNMDSYAPYDSVLRQARAYAAQGIAFMIQDTRGRGESGGTFRFFHDEANDGYDTIEWIATQPWSNGQVAMIGGSYKGTVQWLAARERPPHLTCLFSQAPAGNYFNEIPYTGGVFQMRWNMNWPPMVSGRLMHQLSADLSDYDAVLSHRPLMTMDLAFGRELPMVREFLQHPTLDDWWKRSMLWPEDFARIDVPAFHVSGWYDGQLPGNMRYWNGMREHSKAQRRQYLLIGPWNHAETRSGGSPTFGERQRGTDSVVDLDALALRWFKSCFAGTTEQFDAPRARLFLTGINRWIDLPDYPAPDATPRALYLQSGGDAVEAAGGRGRLVGSAPKQQRSFEKYVFNPLDPAPGRGSPDKYQAAGSKRGDVLIYTTDAVTEPLAMVGPVDLVLHVATSARDADFIGMLYDVDPSGRALKIVSRNATLRARYREGFEKQVPMTPGTPTQLRLQFFDVGHVLLPGHRLRLEITSSAPGLHPNPGTGNDIGTDTKWVMAEHTVFQDAKRPSRLEFTVIPAPAT
jgi:putative CocE/NonD family hydrolase